MIGIYHETINMIPTLIIVDEAKKEEALPLIVYFHGFTSAKEHNLPLAYLLAEQGYRVVLPDSIYHGERESNSTMTERQMAFWDIVLENVTELQRIKNFFEQKGYILNDRIGVAGTSMGGITTAAALTQYQWINTAAVLMGAPKLIDFATMLVNHNKKIGTLHFEDDKVETLLRNLHDYDLSKKVDTLSERPLLFWHGTHDKVVPFDLAFSFYKDAKNAYHDQNKIQFLQEKNRDHKVSRYAILETANWFQKYL